MQPRNGEEHPLFFPLGIVIALAIIVPVAHIFDPSGPAMFGVIMGAALIAMLVAIGVLGRRMPWR